MQWNKICITTILIGCLFLYQGCQSSIRSGGADAQAKYAWGALKAELDYPLETTYRAAKKAAEQLELSIYTDRHDEVAGLITARDAQNDEVKIKLEALPQSRTIMTVRVGTVGDKNKSHVIFNQVLDNLRR